MGRITVGKDGDFMLGGNCGQAADVIDMFMGDQDGVDITDINPDELQFFLSRFMRDPGIN